MLRDRAALEILLDLAGKSRVTFHRPVSITEFQIDPKNIIGKGAVGTVYK